MNFIKDRELALRFKNNTVSSKERFLYLLFGMIFTTFLLSSFVISHTYCEGFNKWDYFVDIVTMALTLFGTFLCYRTNKKGDDKEFIERYVSICFPVTIQSLLLFVILRTALLVIDALIFQGEISNETTAYDLLIYTAHLIYFFWRLNSSIKVASS